MTHTTPFQKAFEQNANEYVDRAMISALEVLPHVFSLIRPNSVVDVGCGAAAWLAACRTLGITDTLGIDGDYVQTEKLKIPSECFHAHDLRQPLTVARRFDLAISLEVAEHLPASSSEIFVASLIRLAPVILFSAAIPFQGGVGHVNEQWPTYWEKLFRQRGYKVVDSVRRRIWNNEQVDTWYKQNSFLFVDEDYLASHDALTFESQKSEGFPLDLVHPNRYLNEANPRSIEPEKVPLGTAWKALNLQAIRAVRSRLHWRIRRMLQI